MAIHTHIYIKIYQCPDYEVSSCDKDGCGLIKVVTRYGTSVICQNPLTKITWEEEYDTSRG